MSHAIEVSGLTKHFGKIVAVDDLSFTVDEGRVVGFLGPNGAGKTTTLRMLLGLVNPTAGTATVHGRPFVEIDDPVHTVGAVLDGGDAASRAEPAATTSVRSRSRPGSAIRASMSCWSWSRSRTRATGARADTRWACASGSAWRRRCSATRGSWCSTSPRTGSTRRHPVAAGLPARLASEGRAILVSSHVLAEVGQTADDVVVINKGRSVAQGPLEEIMARSANRRRDAGQGPGRPPAGRHPVRRRVQVSGTDSEIFVQGKSGEDIGRLIAHHQLVVSELSPIGASLEDIFFELTGSTGGPS